MIVRELTGGLYFGRRERFYDEPAAGVNGAPGQRAYDTLEYSEYEIERIARQAFEIARKRRGKVTSVDKANVLETSRLWREIVHRVHDADYADVELEDLLVDNTAMQLHQPSRRFRRGGDREHVRQTFSLTRPPRSRLAGHARQRFFGRRRGPVRAEPRQRAGTSPGAVSPTRWHRSFPWR